ncbi:hypothetical protein B0I72DRAFT_134204 [Yarrowia lipolytica]|jgi:hypothetical protein|uniref:YALI0E33913p n=2 Tax=Yarrowia lipolytica TaxID=4952 RepID=W0TYM8_YARLI|nr:YALI0E33913p [Yarrowia lipolytica CLIB122]AOW06360.1 hypothetical protein YALI1_E40251g [Yarrowia lipolytica]KAB8282654.1 hypothetical protein BKA91DRAFT_138151 [Yarrowia lipolytica]KAE8171188.1 hypothetical protein BKA90DRAFT_139508 [Yarrowia lipolytica]KAJ8057732.1 hypothetical protein LXG23DRAFT_15545 [Yarrowia lipolytica]QNQ00909.1 Hypothetical protein YALI2_F00454g [Yarrowia lipolytica]|eukprot:XP_002143097.1 YALI0E33913p [Yarrowia lipolytica CLIB122]
MTSLDFAFPPRLDHSFPASPRQMPAITIERGDSGTTSQSSESSEASAASTTSTMASSLGADVSSRTASPRKHAHRRSAAVSCDFDAQVLFNKHDYLPPNPHKQNISTSTTTLAPPQPVSIPAASQSPKRDVAFIDPPRVLGSPPRMASPSVSEQSSSSQLSTSQISSRSASPSKSSSPKKNRHKKVRSWAGSLIKFRSSSSLRKGKSPMNNTPGNGNGNGNNTNSMTDENTTLSSPTLSSPTLHSSSYIATNDPFYCPGAGSPEVSPSPSSKEFETIDLDAALYPLTLPPSTTSRFHRRSESAPEAMLDPTRGMKRKIRALVGEDLLSLNGSSADDAIIEEEEPSSAEALGEPSELSEPVLTPASSTCSQLVSANASASSLVSVSSSSTRSRSRTRFHRSYNNDLAQAMKDRKERDERDKREKQEAELQAQTPGKSFESTFAATTPAGSGSMHATPTAPTGACSSLQSPLRTVRKMDAPRLLGSPSRMVSQDLPRYTYEEEPRFSTHYSFTSEWNDDFGEPGPVEHADVSAVSSRTSDISEVHSDRNSVSRYQSHHQQHGHHQHSHHQHSPSSHKNVAARMWGWVKRK